MKLSDLVEQQAHRLDQAGLSFGQGTLNAYDEAAWLVLWSLGLPLDTDLEGDESLNPEQLDGVHACIQQRIETRQPPLTSPARHGCKGFRFMWMNGPSSRAALSPKFLPTAHWMRG